MNSKNMKRRKKVNAKLFLKFFTIVNWNEVDEDEDEEEDEDDEDSDHGSTNNCIIFMLMLKFRSLKLIQQ
jgi:hypothetical protein